MGEIAGFLIIFFAVLILAGFAGQIARWAMKKAGLSSIDRFLGAVLGLLRGALVVAIVLTAMTAFAPAARGWTDPIGSLFPGRRKGGNLARTVGIAPPLLPGTGLHAAGAFAGLGQQSAEAGRAGEVVQLTSNICDTRVTVEGAETRRK